MAATVGATLSGATFPLRHSGLGPFISAAGNVYWFGRDGATNIGNARCWKAADPIGGSFTAQTAKLMSSGATVAIEAMWAAQRPGSNVVDVFAQIATGAVYFNFYTMDTDTWGLTTSAVSVAAAGFAPSLNTTFVSAVYRPTAGELVLEYCAGLTAMSSGFNMVRYQRVNVATGAIIGSAVNVDNGGSVNWSGGVAGLGASDRVHFFLQSITANSAYQRTLTAANALQTFPSAFDASVGSTSVTNALAPPIAYVDTGVTKVRTFYKSNTSGLVCLASMDSADSPTVSTVTGLSDRLTKNNNASSLHRAAADGSTVHYLYADNTDADLYHDSSAGGGGAFATDVEEWDAITGNTLTVNVYTRSGTKYLAMVLDDGGTIKYAEITLTVPASLLFDQPFQTMRPLLTR